MNAKMYKLFGIVLVTAIPAFLCAQEKAPPPNPPTLSPTDTETPDVATPLVPFAAPTTEWLLHKTEDGAHPDGNEQTMVWLMNRARSNPTQEGLFLADTGHPRVESAINEFGVDLDVLISEFADIDPKQPAAFDRRIYLGSEAHSLDLIDRDAQDHTEQIQRVDAAGFVMNGYGASVYSYSQDAVQAHAAFNIDWGDDGGSGDGMQPDRGHRAGLVNSVSFPLPNVGIAMVPEDDDNTSVGPLVTSITYAQANTLAEDHFNKFLVGTVWEDLNSNGIYDPGEGLSGVTVMPDTGTHYAVTGEAGGYAIPVAADGIYLIEFSGGDLAEPAQRLATVEGVSALVVWNPVDSYNGLQPLAPNLSLARSPDGILASWAAETDMEYALETSPDGVTWDDDSRTITIAEGIGSFLVTFAEIESTLLFRVVVTAADTSQSQ